MSNQLLFLPTRPPAEHHKEAEKHYLTGNFGCRDVVALQKTFNVEVDSPILSQAQLQ